MRIKIDVIRSYSSRDRRHCGDTRWASPTLRRTAGSGSGATRMHAPNRPKKGA